VLLATGPVQRPRLVAALRAGVTDVWSLPMDAEELALRLGALVRGKLAVERVREEALLDGPRGSTTVAGWRCGRGISPRGPIGGGGRSPAWSWHRRSRTVGRDPAKQERLEISRPPWTP